VVLAERVTRIIRLSGKDVFEFETDREIARRDLREREFERPRNEPVNGGLAVWHIARLVRRL